MTPFSQRPRPAYGGPPVTPEPDPEAEAAKLARIKAFVDPILSFDFAAERKRRDEEIAAKKAEDMQVFLAGPDLPDETPCMRWVECHANRWRVPTTSSVLCREHTLEVLRGERRAPPLRSRRDYTSVGRKTFLVETVPGLPVYFEWADKKDEDPK